MSNQVPEPVSYPTPRTDKEATQAAELTWWVPAEFARQLEMELAEANYLLGTTLARETQQRERATEAEEDIECLNDRIKDYQAIVASWKEWAEGVVKILPGICDEDCQLEERFRELNKLK